MPGVSLGPSPKVTVLDANGDPISGAQIGTFQSGTNTPLATYTDYTGTVVNANPTICDSAGRCDMWFQSAAYRIRVSDSNGVQLYVVDGFSVGVFPASNIIFAGDITFQGTTTFDGPLIANNGGSLNGSFSGNPNFTGSPTFAGTIVANRFQALVATGTAPLIIASTTNVPNLNVRNINGVDYPTTGTTGQIPVLTGANVIAYQSPATIVGSAGYKVENSSTTVTTVTNTVVSTDLYSFTLPANELAVNQILHLYAGGDHSSVAGNGSFFALHLTIDGVTIANFGEYAAQTASTRGWSVDINIACTAAGGPGNITVTGSSFSMPDGVGPAETFCGALNSSAFNTTISHTVAIAAEWSVGVTATESITARQFIAERLG